MSSPTSNPPLNMGQRRTTKLGAWHQRETDGAIRRQVYLRILLLLKRRYGRLNDRLSCVAKKAEFALYCRSGSLEEYRDVRFLFERLEAVVRKTFLSQIMLNPEVFKVMTAPQEKAVVFRSQKLASNLLSIFSSVYRPIQESIEHLPEDILRYALCFATLGDKLRLSTCASSLRPVVQTTVSCFSLTVHTLANSSMSSLVTMARAWSHVILELEVVQPLEPTMREPRDINALKDTKDRTLETVRALSKCFTSVLPQLVQVQSIRFNGVYCDDLEDHITTYIATSLERIGLPSLKMLELRGNVIGDLGALALSTWISSGGCPESIDLTKNCVGEFGFKALVKAVEEHHEHESKRVWLHDNLVLPDLAQRVASALTVIVPFSDKVDLCQVKAKHQVVVTC